MRSRPQISVVTASRNAARTLAALYESLDQQNCDEFEWIIADAQSKDGTVQLLENCASRSEWVRFVSEPDAGIYDGINKALRRATGEYYLVAGADDVFAATSLARYSELARSGKADVIMARALRADRVIGGFYPRRAWLGPSRVFASPHSIGTMIRRSLHQRFGWYSMRFPLLADAYFLKTLLRSGAVSFAEADFIAGTFAEGGATSTEQVALLAENWQIQMLTEPHPWLQSLLLIGKTAVRYRAVRSELRARRKRPVQG